jgi:hypothetical protein
MMEPNDSTKPLLHGQHYHVAIENKERSHISHNAIASQTCEWHVKYCKLVK